MITSFLKLIGYLNPVIKFDWFKKVAIAAEADTSNFEIPLPRVGFVVNMHCIESIRFQ
jgi:hypothetical protein